MTWPVLTISRRSNRLTQDKEGGIEYEETEHTGYVVSKTILVYTANH